MALMNFMEVEGAPGDANDSAHKNWCDIEPFDISVSHTGTYAVGGGGGSGGADLHDLSIQALIDKAYPVIFNMMCTGHIVPKVTLHRSVMSNKKSIPVDTVKLTKVKFTSVGMGSGKSSDGLPMVTYGITFEQFEVGNTAIDGAGNAKAAVMGGWNAATNKKV